MNLFDRISLRRAAWLLWHDARWNLPGIAFVLSRPRSWVEMVVRDEEPQQ